MNRNVFPFASLWVAAAAFLLANPTYAVEVDADAAQSLLKKSDCGACHSVDKKKVGPSFKETAARLEGKAGAEDEIYKHLTAAPMIKIDGKEEVHKTVKSKDEAQVRNLARWILSR